MVDAGHGAGATPDNATWTYGYDLSGRLVREDTPAVTRHWEAGEPTGAIREQYAYDVLGNRTLVLHDDGTGIRYRYDKASPATGCGDSLDPGYVTPVAGDDDPRTLDEVWYFEGVPLAADGHADVGQLTRSGCNWRRPTGRCPSVQCRTLPRCPNR